MSQTAPSTGGPLAGLRVLDLTANVAGPFGTLILADLGAEVIKLERPGRGEDSRHLAPFADGRSTTFEALNRGKRSIAVDLRSEGGREVASRLIRETDVLVESMRPGKLDALGFDEATLRALQPDLTLASLSGFGQTGPMRDRPGYDMLIQAKTGIMHITGQSDGPPVRVGPSIVDIGTGMWLGMAVLASQLHRANGERGFQRLDISLFDCGVSWVILPLLQYAMTGNEPARMGGQTPIAVPADIYPTADGYVTVSILNDKIWSTFVEESGLAHRIDAAAYATNAERVENRAALTELISTTLRERPTTEWIELLRPAGVTIEPIDPVSRLLDDAHVQARSLLVGGLWPGAGAPLQVRLPLHNSGFDDRSAVAPAPSLGEHTDEVLTQAGFSMAELSSLRSAGGIA